MIKQAAKNILPVWLFKKISVFIIRFNIKKTKLYHKQALVDVAKKEKIKVAFFLIYESIWKYEKLYFLLEKDDRFDPVVFVCPFKTYGQKIMYEEMNRTFQSFKNKGYTVFNTLKDDGTFIDVKFEFKPDLVFFTNPWNHTISKYLIDNFLDTLTCFVPYSFNSSNLYQYNYNIRMHNFCWMVFVETSYHKRLSEIHSLRKGDNFVVTGYPGIDNLIDKTYQPSKAWRSMGKSVKKIIWAPHHTIPGCQNALNYSTFLLYADFMLEIAQENQDKIQICFKPHPNLKGKLSNQEIWGVKKTEEYYQKWANLPNGQIAEGDYIDLFLESDAMIHDSSSFLLEYLYTQKPVMFLISHEEVKQQFNELGKKALEVIDLGYTKKDILKFVDEVVINDRDLIKEQRYKFYNDYLRLIDKKTASENIYNNLITKLKKQ